MMEQNRFMWPFRRLFVLLLLGQIISGANGLNKEQVVEEKEKAMASFNATCKPRDECRLDKSNRMADTPDWKARNCMCDDDCAIYGDCCADAKKLNATMAYAARERFKCVDLKQYGSNYMIIKCPRDWEDENVRSLCESDPSEDVKDPMRIIPVTSKSSRMTYRNYFCAACNHESDADLHAWSPRIECPTLDKSYDVTKVTIDNFVWNDFTSAWGLEVPKGDEFEWYQCFVDPYIPPDLELYVRPCKKWNDECPSSDTTLKNLCAAYAGFVNVNYNIYRNIHCAICNNETDTVGCDDGPQLRINDRSEFNFHAFAVLFDLNDADGSGNVGLVKKCESGSFFDPFFKKCRRLYCLGKNVMLKDGICVPKQPDVIFNETTTERPFGDYNTSLEFQTCPKFMLSKGDYDLKENNSLYVPVYGKTFESNEYELVNGSVFICSEWVTEVSKFDTTLGWFSLVCIIISECCLLVHLAFGFLTNEFKNLSGKNLQSLCVSLFVAFGLFLAAQFVPQNTLGCVIVGVFMHYFFLSAFFWTSALAFDVYKTLELCTTQLRSPGGQAKKFIFYSIWAWVGPAVIVAISLVIEFADPDFIIPSPFHPHYGKHICWFGQRRALLVYFAAPLAAILGTNLVFYFWSLYIIKSSALNPPNPSSVGPRKDLALFSRLAVLMGLSWIFGLIAGAADVTALWYVFVLFCALQGVFILFSFTLKSKTLRNYFKNLRGSTAGRFDHKRVSKYDETDHTHSSTLSGVQ